MRPPDDNSMSGNEVRAVNQAMTGNYQPSTKDSQLHLEHENAALLKVAAIGTAIKQEIQRQTNELSLELRSLPPKVKSATRKLSALIMDADEEKSEGH